MDEIKAVSSADDVAAVARLAREIWREHYVPIIGAAQVEYMLKKFQSASAVASQIKNESFRYFLIYHDDSAVGYIGVQDRGDELFLSKLYVAKSARGHGHGKRAVAFVRDLAVAAGKQTISLTVNRHNAAAIKAYQRTGFTRTGAVVTDIGGGYVMDDFVFELKLDDDTNGTDTVVKVNLRW